MKKILITGANSYIGMSFEKYIKENYPNDYTVDTVDMIDGSWREKSFADYDSVFHVAGIAHQKETKKNAELYYKVNRDLAIETAKKAKNDGVKQFIFLSSMSVYGMDMGVITKDTTPNPKSHYGISKFEAEERMTDFRSKAFALCILRPPMVYGEGCKGNYKTLARIAEKSPIFPYVNNCRSTIYIENLARFVLMAIEHELSGVFFPQDEEYANTRQIVQKMAEEKGKRIHFSFLCGLCVVLLRPFVPVIKKAFGNLIYKNVEDFNFCYCVKDE